MLCGNERRNGEISGEFSLYDLLTDSVHCHLKPL
jgi:hypothetical protein